MRDRIFIHYLREAANILSLDGQPGLRKQILTSYTRLFWRYILAVKFSYKKTAPVPIGKFTIPPTDFGVLRHLYEELFIERNYDLALGTDHPCIIDCGSNIGMSVLFFKDVYPKARIIAFEPDPRNFDQLQSTVLANVPDVTVYNMAISDEPGEMKLYSSITSQSGITTKSLYRERLEDTSVQSETVKVVRLSDYVQSPVDLIKVDVEGAEVAVIHDLITSDAINLVRNMIIEFHDIKQEGRQTLSEFLARLGQQGFLLKLSAEPQRSEGRIDVKPPRDILVYASRP